MLGSCCVDIRLKSLPVYPFPGAAIGFWAATGDRIVILIGMCQTFPENKSFAFYFPLRYNNG